MAGLERRSDDVFGQREPQLKFLDQKMVELDEMGQEHSIRLPEDEEEVVAKYRRGEGV